MITSLQVYRPGVGWVSPLQDRVTLSSGDTLRVGASVPYKGPAKTFTLYATIGTRGMFGFDEILSAQSSLPCPASESAFVTVGGSVDIPIAVAGIAGVGGISSGVNYDLLVKIAEVPTVYAEVDDVIDVVGGAGGGGITDMLSSMMGMMMLAMVVPMVMPMFEEEVAGGGESMM